MNDWFDWIVGIQLDYGYLIKPLIVGTLVSIVCSVVGCFIVLRGMSFLADAIAHSMLAGVIGGYLLMKLFFNREADLGGMIIGAILAGIVTVAMIGFVTRVSRIKQDTAIGIMYTGIFAAGAFAVSLNSIGQLIHIDIYHFIVGSVLAVSNAELWLIAIVSSFVISAIILFFRPLQITSFDPVMAASIGVPVLAVEYLLTACTSLVVVSGVHVAGVILVVALIITPAATAYLLTDRLSRMLMVSAGIAAAGYWIGFWLSLVCGSSPGASIVVTMTGFFLLSLLLAPKYGLLADWLRQARQIPQELKEDVMGAIWRSENKAVEIKKLLQSDADSSVKLKRAISMLVRQDFLNEENGVVTLTEKGHREAMRLVRAHRLWETYLTKTSTPQSEIHAKAHQLEHISDDSIVDYLDDKLGHPLLDPHGSEIPEDSAKLGGMVEFKASLLREGRIAKVCRIKKAAHNTGLKTGHIVTAGKRSADGATWTFIEQDGREFLLNHDQADAVLVQLIERNSD